MAKQKKIKRNDSLAKVQKSLGFTEQDLKANRDGNLSKRQSRKILLVVLLNFVFFAGFSTCSMATYIFFDSPMYGMAWEMRPFFPIISIAFIFFAILSPWRHLPDFFGKHPHVRSISGQVRVSAQTPQHHYETFPIRTYSLYVLFFDPARGYSRSDSFAIPESVYRALDNNNDLYTVYYLPHAMILIAIEKDHFNPETPETIYTKYKFWKQIQ